MPAILAIVSEILQAVLEILGIASVLQSGTNAIENFLGIHTGGVTLQQIYDQAHLANVNTLFVSDVGTISLLDIHNQIAALSSQVAAYSPAATSVQIPTVPPTGYGGTSGSDVATAVWTYLNPANALAMRDNMTYAASMSRYFADITAEIRSVFSPGWRIGGDWSTFDGTEFFGNEAPNLDYSTILATDASVLAWLTRVYGGPSYVAESDGSVRFRSTLGPFFYHTVLDSVQFEAIKSGSSGTASIIVPPIWPGLAKATLSTTHALSDGLIITEPMDGVILALTSVAPPIQRIHYGTVEAYGHIGALSFGNDNGDQEAFQFISFANQVYCTLHNKRAASVVIKLRAGISGTATPWTVT